MAIQELLEQGFLLEVVESLTGLEYYIIQTDINGQPLRLSITEELYNFYEEEKMIANRLSNWNRNHRDMRELEHILVVDDYARARERMIREQRTRDMLDGIAQVLKTCTPIEQRRFALKFVKGYTYVEIAHSEGKSEASVKESVYKVRRKINKLETL